MKRRIIIFITILLGTQATAQQHWSAGFRLGGRFDNLYDYVDETKVNIEPSVFITRRVYKRLHAEIGISYFRLNQDSYKHLDPHHIDFLDRKETINHTIHKYWC